MKTPEPIPPQPVNRGFALVVTLSLMILLTIIAVGLLSLSAVSLRSSSQGQAASEARANARLALMMAIGELQKELGPDSRISAPHDAGSTATGGKPNWTAVYDAWRLPDDPNAPETPQTRAPRFRSWLVSGASGSTGEQAKLVGSNSLGANPLPADEVSVPMQAVSVGNQKGRIAWWTADESVKAKVNAGLENPGGGTTVASPLLDAQSVPHVGHRAIPELAGFEWQAGQRSVAITNGAVDLAANLGNRGIGNLNHAVTVHSAGVLSDVRAGRLKRDLSSLLSRPVAQLQNKPLYLANGRINRFVIDDTNGSVSNAAGLPANAAGANRWGINLEELHLFHQLHREVDWSTGKPRLVNKDTKEEMAQDRFFIYRKPKMEAMNVMLSFIAETDSAPDTYRIAAMLDAMVSTSNPNDIPIVWPAGVQLRMEMEGFPYTVRWNIRKANNQVRHNHTVGAINRPFFQSSIRNGFTLEPGEAAVFGASTTDTQSRSVNLTRGYAPRGGVRINESEWGGSGNPPGPIGLRATGLASDDKIDFQMIPAPATNGATPSGWISCYAEIRNSSGGANDIRISTHRLAGGGGSVLTNGPIKTYMPSPIRPSSQSRELSGFIGEFQPVMMVTTMLNVEQSRDGMLLPPNAFPSRPYQLHEPAISNMVVSTTTPENTVLTMQNSQLVTIAETMDYDKASPRTMPVEGNLYHGGGRAIEDGGSLYVIKRRIPLSAPLSLGAFENAIACGLTQRFSSPGNALNGIANDLPAMAKTIGNSWSNPFLSSSSVTDGAYHDASWMANTALWDSWFLSGIVDGRGTGSNPFLNDSRSPRAQFLDLAEATGTLRNKRLAYNRRQSVEAALNELFDGEAFKPSAINKLPKYLLVDGAFNVNSTSVEAWKAFLTSVREQELLNPDGSAGKRDHPFGTLGYAATQAASDPAGDWSGFKDLTDSQMDGLAQKIVDEVKVRGPFLSMADFVNRRPNGSNDAQKALGALQAAINNSGINDGYNEAERNLTEADVPSLAGKTTLTHEKVPARSIGSAGFLSQAALLSSLGSQITVRGDTFVIRTYGDARDASGNKIIAKAWCEAVVQRFPEYVDGSNAPETSGALSSANTTFGRKFEIISFRWLNSKEIAEDI